MRIATRIEKDQQQTELTIHAKTVETGCQALRDWGYDVTPLCVNSPAMTKTKNNASTQEQRDAILAGLDWPAAEKGLLFEIE